MRSQTRASTLEIAFAVAIPAVWAALSLLHPFTLDDLTHGGQSTRWIAVHTAQLAMTPMLALVMLGVLRGLHSTEAAIAKIAVVMWAAFFSAFDAIAGIATGVLARNGEAEAAVLLFEHGVVGGDVTVLSVIAHPLWGIAAVATATALRTAGHRRATTIGLWLSVPFALTHVGPLAMVAMIGLAVGLATAIASQRSTREHISGSGTSTPATTPLARPTPDPTEVGHRQDARVGATEVGQDGHGAEIFPVPGTAGPPAGRER